MGEVLPRSDGDVRKSADGGTPQARFEASPYRPLPLL